MRTLPEGARQHAMLGSWLAVLVLSVATVTLYVDNKRTRECIAGYMVADTDASKVRFGVAEEERQQFKDTLRVLISGEADPTKRRAAVESYVKLLDENDKIRKANPIVPVPTECD